MERKKLKIREWLLLGITICLILCAALQYRTSSAPGKISAGAWVQTETGAWRINLNTADRERLMALPGVGEVLAERIIAYREANGPFARPEDLLHVSGIGEKSYGKLADYITVEDNA